MRLAERVAIITGAPRGIGRAVARGFAREGARVVINYLDYENLAHEAVAEIAAMGGEALAYPADVTSSTQIAAMVTAVLARFGTIDVLVNNAALSVRAPWHEISEAEWDRILAVNLKGCFLCARAVYPIMRRQGRGRIINVSSVTALRGQEHLAHYIASKAGIIGFTRAIAREVGRDGITVNAITPGAVQTEHELENFAAQQEEIARQMAAAQSIPRREVAEDLVGAFIFLASDESAMITGQTLNVDGGWVTH
jgi:3-oxoacyl-[acyl-carrier protein] reductase